MDTNTQRIPLRQRKHAQVKLSLLEAALKAMRRRSFDDVNISELCEAAQVSQATFFNYFPAKADLLVYFVQLWSLEMACHAAQLARTQGGLRAIEEVYALTARRAAEQPGVMGEIIAFQARLRREVKLPVISLAERLLAFPELEGAAEAQAGGLDTVIAPLLAQAIEGGELPADVDRPAALVALASVFFGAPLLHRKLGRTSLESVYRQQLQIIWRGLRTRNRKETS